jgi:serine/threonine protein kinase
MWTDPTGEESPFYAMPLYDESLRQVIDRGIPANMIIPYFGQMLDAVEAAHLKNVIHRDLKPENFLFAGESDQLVLADFGIAHFQEEDLWTAVETKSAERLANFKYRAPEQLARGGSVDTRSDIYALGLILNEMFTGHVPQGHEFPTVASLHPDYEYLDGLIASMCNYDSSKRVESIDHVKQQLIGRRNEFISRQRLSELKNTVVESTDLDDQLIIDPPRIVDFDWEKGILTLKLNKVVNGKWTRILRELSYSGWHGVAPGRFTIEKDYARIDMHEDGAQKAIDAFKSHLTRTNAGYKARVRREREAAEQKKRAEFQREVAEQEKRLRVLSSLKI